MLKAFVCSRIFEALFAAVEFPVYVRLSASEQWKTKVKSCFYKTMFTNSVKNCQVTANYLSLNLSPALRAACWNIAIQVYQNSFQNVGWICQLQWPQQWLIEWRLFVCSASFKQPLLTFDNNAFQGQTEKLKNVFRDLSEVVWKVQ